MNNAVGQRKTREKQAEITSCDPSDGRARTFRLNMFHRVSSLSEQLLVSNIRLREYLVCYSPQAAVAHRSIGRAARKYVFIEVKFRVR